MTPALWEHAPMSASVRHATEAVYLTTRLAHRLGDPFGDNDAIDLYRRVRRMSEAEAARAVGHLRARLLQTKPRHPSIQTTGAAWLFAVVERSRAA